MSADASLPLQKALINALRDDAALTALVNKRVYDAVPDNAQKPYLSLGPVDVLTEEAEEYEGSDISFQVDGWSTAVGKVEAKRIGRAVRDALHNANLPLEESQRLVVLSVERIQYLEEPDGITKHAVISGRARTEPSA